MNKSQRNGAIGQNEAIATLQRLGFLTAQEIATPVSLSPVDVKKSIYRVRWKKKVNGDHTAILAGGLFVLAETKTTSNHENLAYSELDDNQRRNLSNHAKAGGLALLTWVSDWGIYVMEWGVDGIAGFDKPRTSIKSEQAAILHNQLTGKLIHYEMKLHTNPVSAWDGREVNLNWVRINL